MSHDRNRVRGFTLVELLACVIILGVLGAIAAPSFFDSQTFVTRGYADEVASSLRYAQRIAIASGCGVQVRIDAAGYSGWQQSAFATCNGAGAWNQGVVRADGTPLAGATPAGIDGPANSTLVFQSDGSLAGGASINISVGTRVVIVNGTTGRVSVH